jgi:hypothetical protein
MKNIKVKNLIYDHYYYAYNGPFTLSLPYHASPSWASRCQCEEYLIPDGRNICCPVCDYAEYTINNKLRKISCQSSTVSQAPPQAPPQAPQHRNVHEHYCEPCGILYRVGCTYVSTPRGNEKYGHIILKWKYLLNDEIYNGMPHFENSNEWAKEICNIEILDWACLGFGSCCPLVKCAIAEAK